MITKNSHLALTVFPLITSVSAAVNCGEKTCNNYEYCVDDGFCNSCEDICQSSSHNYDEATCKLKCSGYNFDRLYLKRTDFDDALREIYIYVAVSLAVSIVVLILVLSSFMALWLKYRKIRSYKNNIEKKLKKKMESIAVVSVNNEVDGSRKLKLDLTVPTIADKDTPPSALTTMTPLSRRHPSEDTTLEYAYDNPTLTYSPDFTKNESVNTADLTPKTSRTETSF